MRCSLFVLFLVLFTIILTTSISATNYYSYPLSGNDVISVNNWWTNRNGTGSHPANFSTAGDYFSIQNGHYMTASNEWVVSGTGSKVIIETGGYFHSSNYVGGFTLDMQSNGTFECVGEDYNHIEFGTVNSNSNFILNNSSINFEDDLAYGNLIIRNGTADVTGSSGLTVTGTLIVESGGTFEGGQTTSHTNTIGNIRIDGGTFYGCTGSATIIYNINIGISVENNGTFYASDGSGSVTYNLNSYVMINSGCFFYACYRAGSLDLPSTYWNIGGSFTNYGNYYARNRAQGGYPTYTFTGTGQNLYFGSVSNSIQCQHSITLAAGSDYTLTSNLYFYEYFAFYMYGTLTTGTKQVLKYGAYDPSLNLYGHLKTAHTGGLIGTSGTTFVMSGTGVLNLQTGCTVEYNAASNQYITPLSTYKYLVLSGSGNKILSNDASVISGISMNCALTITSGKTLYLYGAMSGSSVITGGNITAGGTASTLNLVPCSLGSLTIARNSGCNLTGDLDVTSLYLGFGNLSVGPYNLTIDGQIYVNSGTMTGHSGSAIIVTGSAAQLNLPGINLGTLTINRSNGCLLTGNIGVFTALNLQSGDLSLGSYTLNLYGSINKTSGTMSGSAGILNIGTGSTDVNLPMTALGSLIMNRSGKNCYLTSDLSLSGLTLTNGNVSIGANILTINFGLSRTSGTLTGGSTSSLVLKGNSPYVQLPGILLNSFTLFGGGGCTLNGDMSANSVILTNGMLYLYDKTLTVSQSLTGTTLGSINGTASSTLSLGGASASPLELPQISVGNFNVGRNGTVNIVNTCTIQTSLRLNQGVLNVDASGTLNLNPASYIYRSNGSLTGTPTFVDKVNIVYESDNTTGNEIPASAGVLDKLQVIANLNVTAGSDIYVTTKVTIDDFSLLDLDTHTLTMAPAAGYESGENALIFGTVSHDIGSIGINASVLGLQIDPGNEITGFSVKHDNVSQTLPLGISIERTWTLEGSFTGDNTVSFKWDSSADNGLDFDAQPAVVMVKIGSNWVSASPPLNVSGMNPKIVTVNTDHFSEWTVTTEDQSLPVVLSSFTAIPTQQNYVMLNWITQSETNLLGFKLLRNTEENLSTALDLNELIPATNTSTQQEYSYLDNEISELGTYYYWLQSFELDGQFNVSHAITVTLIAPPGGNDVTPVVDMALLSIYPNPFNPNLFIRVNHKTDDRLTVNVYDVSGRKIRTLTDDIYYKGIKTITWDGKDANNNICASGVYFIHCRSGVKTITSKAILLK